MKNRVYSSGDNPAELWAMRAAYTPLVMRRALGRNASIVRAKRIAIMDETIYNRGLRPPGRFTYRLRKSEKIRFAGATVRIENTATSRSGFKYAQLRHDMRGFSKRYQARKESFWATKAQRETRGDRLRVIRQAQREIIAKK